MTSCYTKSRRHRKLIIPDAGLPYMYEKTIEHASTQKMAQPGRRSDNGTNFKRASPRNCATRALMGVPPYLRPLTPRRHENDDAVTLGADCFVQVRAALNEFKTNKTRPAIYSE